MDTFYATGKKRRKSLAGAVTQESPVGLLNYLRDTDTTPPGAPAKSSGRRTRRKRSERYQDAPG